MRTQTPSRCASLGREVGNLVLVLVLILILVLVLLSLPYDAEPLPPPSDRGDPVG